MILGGTTIKSEYHCDTSQKKKKSKYTWHKHQRATETTPRNPLTEIPNFMEITMKLPHL